MIYMWFTGIDYYKLAVEKDRDVTIITTLQKPGLKYLSQFFAFSGCTKASSVFPRPEFLLQPAVIFTNKLFLMNQTALTFLPFWFFAPRGYA